ncbi:hypothetical protein MMA231_02510 [Asticcacaulis sp. MM231]|uniref:hypothetical protein n=1 Tax=Asticcacaulis sp. MM231 TaxID=3157666 RepID=UPI0032D58A95
MSLPITSRDEGRWLDLIAQAIRLTNPKVSDLGPLKKAAIKATAATLPEEFQGVRDNPFMRLIKGAEALQRDRALDKELLITFGWTCLEKLVGVDLGMHVREELRRYALKNFETFRAVLLGLSKTRDSDAA